MANPKVSALAEQINAWIGSCTELHGAACRPSSTATRPDHHTPDWVIDLHDCCLVAGSKAARYVALSYVWPTELMRRNDIRLQLGNLDAYRQSGSLSAAVVPKVITDATALLMSMGERFLWVDCLCIIQDGPQTNPEIHMMDHIYSGAHLTLVAAGDDGLFTQLPEDVSPQPWWPPECDSRLFSNLTSNYSILLRSKWASRGWTFQEHILSKRAVIFVGLARRHFPWLFRDVNHDILFWNCECALWDEKQPADNFAHHTTGLSHRSLGNPPGLEKIERGTIHDLSQQMETKPWPDFETYLECVCLYNQRDLTRPEDVLVAFSGVLNRLGRSFPGGFVNGMPHAFIDEMLCWQPHQTAQRRIPSELGDTLARREPLPSWSWCGWKCSINPFSILTGLDYSLKPVYDTRRASWRTVPTVNWAILSDNFATVATVSDAGLLAKSKNYLKHHGHDNLQHGWRKHALIANAGSVQQAYFTHAHDPAAHFRYPLPSPAEAPTCFQHSNEPFLSGITTGCRSLTRRPQYVDQPPGRQSSMLPASVLELEYSSANSACALVTLEDKRHCWAGVLRVTDQAIADTYLGGIDLVAISQGEVAFRDLSKFEKSSSFNEHGSRGLRWNESTDEAIALHTELHVELPLSLQRILADSRFPGHNKDVCDILSWEKEAKVELAGLRPAMRHVLREVMREGWLSPLHDAALGDVYQFYNVLWVERINGVAYRKGAGRIKKDIWELYCSEPGTVILG